MKGVLKEPVAVRSIVDEVVERLETAILTGELPAGSKISEQIIADAFGISRAPLREAIRRLEGRRLVQRTPYVGAHVVNLSPEDVLEIFLVREALEGMAARLAAENFTAEEIAGLRKVINPHGEFGPADAEHYQKSPDLDFHYRIAIGSRNARLLELLYGDLYHLLRMYRYRSTQRPGRLQRGLAEHQAIFNAIAARDPDAAEQAMRVHLRNGRINLIAEFQPETDSRPPKIARKKKK